MKKIPIHLVPFNTRVPVDLKAAFDAAVDARESTLQECLGEAIAAWLTGASGPSPLDRMKAKDRAVLERFVLALRRKDAAAGLIYQLLEMFHADWEKHDQGDEDSRDHGRTAEDRTRTGRPT